MTKDKHIRAIRSTLQALLQTNDPDSLPFIGEEDRPGPDAHLMSFDELRTINYSDLRRLADLLGLSDLYAGDNDGPAKH